MVIISLSFDNTACYYKIVISFSYDVEQNGIKKNVIDRTAVLGFWLQSSIFNPMQQWVKLLFLQIPSSLMTPYDLIPCS